MGVVLVTEAPIRGWVARTRLAATGVGVGNPAATAKPRVYANASGSGSADAEIESVEFVVSADAAGVGSVEATTHVTGIYAAVDGVGTSAASAFIREETEANANGSGSADATATPVVNAAASGAGAATGSQIPKVFAAATATGTPAATATVPPSFSALGTATATSAVGHTLSITPAVGDDVYVITIADRPTTVTAMTYGASNLKMTKLLELRSPGTFGIHYMAVHRRRNVAAGAATITVSRTNVTANVLSQAVSYKNVVNYRPIKMAVGGNASTMTHTVTALSSSEVLVQSFGTRATTFTGLSGGTNRYTKNDASLCAMTISDNSGTTTFSTTNTAVGGFTSAVIPIRGGTQTRPYVNDVSEYSAAIASSSGAQNITVEADVGDYVFMDISADRGSAGFSSTPTCAGAAMTLIDSQTYYGILSQTATLYRYRSTSTMASAGSKTISFTSNTGAATWYEATVLSISNINSIGTTSKASSSGSTASTPSHAVSPASNELILHSFASPSSGFSSTPTGDVTCLTDHQTNHQFTNITEEATTIAHAQSVTWGSLATKLAA